MNTPSLPILLLTASAALARADVTLNTQEREVQVETTADGTQLIATAPSFAPFAKALSAAAPFTAPDGTTATNTAVASINCLADPNAISATGGLTAAGGLTFAGDVAIGSASAAVVVNFTVTEATPWHLIASPRPGGPGDRYLLELTQRSPNRDVFVRDESSTVEPVEVTGTLQPGDYRIRYVATLMSTTAESSTQYMFTLHLGVEPCGPSDLGRAGGVQGADGTLDNNDFIAFIDLFFAADAHADRGQAGGLPGGDGVFDNNDFIVFITHFFDGCAA